jgi:hypothetical protein
MRKIRDEHGEPESNDLGSLAQSARLKQLNTARWILIVIGILTMLVNGYLLTTARQQMMDEIRKQNMVIVNQDEFEQSLMLVRLIFVIPAVLGAVFVVLGLMIKAYPVPITITSLVLYVVANLAFALLNPLALLQGLLIKIIIVVALAKAVQAALAYQRAQAEAFYELE